MSRHFLMPVVIVVVFISVAWLARQQPVPIDESPSNNVIQVVDRALKAESHGEVKSLERLMTNASWRTLTTSLQMDEPKTEDDDSRKNKIDDEKAQRRLSAALSGQLDQLEGHTIISRRDLPEGEVEVDVELTFADHTEARTYGLRRIQGTWCISRIAMDRPDGQALTQSDSVVPSNEQ